MKKQKLIAMAALLAAMLLSSASLSLAAKEGKQQPGSSKKDVKGRTAPAKPAAKDLEARRARVRQQQEQRITQEQRQAAADAYKAERLKVYNAREALKKSAPQNIDKQ